MSSPTTQFRTTDLPGVLVIQPAIFRDARGFFLETWHRTRYAEAGIAADFVQDNHSRSQHGTLRGLHANTRRPQGKLIRVIEGEIFDVAVDIRRGSPHFAHWVGLRIGSEDLRQVWVPPGFAHGFCVLSDFAEVEYKVTDFYDPAGDIYIAWNDPAIAIAWPLSEEPLLSPRDRTARPLADLKDVLPVYPADRIAPPT